jgi:hypothetical protein
MAGSSISGLLASLGKAHLLRRCNPIFSLTEIQPVAKPPLYALFHNAQRVRICEELGITDWPKFIRKGLSEEGQFAHARQLNIARRHINQAQKRELIADQLRATPHLANSVIASMLGVDDKTVDVVRKELEAGSEIPNQENSRKGRQSPQKA